MHKVSAKPRTSAQTNGWTHFRPLSDFEPRVSKTAKQLFFQQHPACRKGLNSTPNIACTENLKPIQFSLVANIDYRKVRGDLNLSMLSLQLLSPFNQGPQKKSPFNQENMQPSMDMHFFRKAPYEPSWLRPYYMYFKQKATHRSLI